MMSVQKINDLIEAGWNVMEEDFDIRAVCRWKREAVEFLADEFGPDHYYTQYFKNNIRKLERQNILAGGGILTAAKEVISRNDEN
jgi:uncharacterized protein (DUF2164 family)